MRARYLRACLSEQIEEKKHERALEAEMDVTESARACSYYCILFKLAGREGVLNCVGWAISIF